MNEISTDTMKLPDSRLTGLLRGLPRDRKEALANKLGVKWQQVIVNSRNPIRLRIDQAGIIETALCSFYKEIPQGIFLAP
jgi:hypothetical protein